MRTNDSLQEIKTTLENIRNELYPDLESGIIKGIIDIQFRNQEKGRRVNGRSATQSLIKEYVEKKV